jgi:2-(1,2-epoxy-1,2-dihydrophenyl)acetyl-CoA isomerase
VPPTPLESYHPNLRVEADGLVSTVTLDAPSTRNACNGEMFVALGRIFRDLSWSGTRAIVLTGAGGNFCTGADLSGPGSRDDPGDDAGPSATMIDGMRVLADAVLAIHGCPVPIISKVDGLCVGAGFGLALNADLTWCSDRARFSAIFAKRGLSLDFGTSWLLSQRIGSHKAKELAFTARMVEGPEAYEIGFVNGVVPADDLDKTVDEVAQTIAAGPPVALSLSKRQLNGASTMSLAQALEVEAISQSVNSTTEDMREAMMAWFEKRPPTFKGR